MATHMYRVGDYVYFDASSGSPYQVRRIEELNKTPNGNVEAKVMCFFRRRDLPTSLNYLADKHQSALEEEEGKDREVLNAKQKHLLKHRELFLSRQVESLPATQIRGKCSVTLLNEAENILSYLNKDDAFFYSLVYDPQQKTLLADRGEIRVGQRYQAETIKPPLAEGESDGRVMEELESLTWTPDHSLTDKQIDQFLVLSRSVGTFARALDSSSSVKQPSLHMSAAAASRDVTLFHAMDTLHKYKYDVSAAASALVPSSGPVLVRDEMEEWSSSEANLFEEALEKYGKDFTDIRADFLPWKTLTNIIEYYYMWKTTDRYVQQKRVKAAEAETKLKQVYIPNYNKPNPSALSSGIKGMLNGGNSDQLIPGTNCESCMSAASTQWFAWTSLSGVQAKLCNNCWNYWRKYGGLKTTRVDDLMKPVDGEVEVLKKHAGQILEDGEMVGRNPGLMQQRLHRCAVAGCNKEFKMKNQLARHYAASHGFSMGSGSPRPVMKTRTAFYLFTTPLTRVARRVCSDILRVRHATRSPFWPVNVVGIKQECQQRVAGKTADELKSIITGRNKKLPHAKVSEIGSKLGHPVRTTPEWLILTEKAKLLGKQPDKVAFPKPLKNPDGSLIYDRIPDKVVAGATTVNNISPTLNLKRSRGDEVQKSDGETGPPTKRTAWEGSASTPVPKRSSSRGASPLPLTAQSSATLAVVNNSVSNGTKTKIASVTRVGSRKQIISWQDAPDDLYFTSTEGSKKLRKSLTSSEMRRLARSPCKKVIAKGEPETPITVSEVAPTATSADQVPTSPVMNLSSNTTAEPPLALAVTPPPADPIQAVEPL